jgi:hypothetical protein
MTHVSQYTTSDDPRWSMWEDEFSSQDVDLEFLDCEDEESDPW